MRKERKKTGYIPCLLGIHYIHSNRRAKYYVVTDRWDHLEIQVSNKEGAGDRLTAAEDVLAKVCRLLSGPRGSVRDDFIVDRNGK